MNLKNDLNIFIEHNQRDTLKLIGRLNHWYKNGCGDGALTEVEFNFIQVVEEAHRMMLDLNNRGNKTTISNKIKHLYGIKSTDQVVFILNIADALYNSERAFDKRYRKAMINELLTRKMLQADEENDHKALDKYITHYREMNKLDETDDDNDNPIIEKVIQFSDNPQLIASYDADNDAKVLETIARFEIKAKKYLNGE